jgi:hypothetical protein
LTRRLDAVPYALRQVASIMIVLCSALSATRPTMIRTKTPLSPQHFQRLQRGSSPDRIPSASRNTEPIAIDGNYAAEGTEVINAGLAMTLGEGRLQPLYLRAGQPVRLLIG